MGDKENEALGTVARLSVHVCMALACAALVLWNILSLGRLLRATHVFTAKKRNQKIVIYFGILCFLLVESVYNVLATFFGISVVSSVFETISGICASLLLAFLFCGSSFYWYVMLCFSHNSTGLIPIPFFSSLLGFMHYLFKQRGMLDLFVQPFICKPRTPIWGTLAGSFWQLV